jgi:hypothetical protein
MSNEIKSTNLLFLEISQISAFRQEILNETLIIYANVCGFEYKIYEQKVLDSKVNFTKLNTLFTSKKFSITLKSQDTNIPVLIVSNGNNFKEIRKQNIENYNIDENIF